MSKTRPRRHPLRTLWCGLRLLIVLAATLLALTGSIVPASGLESRVRTFTHASEFDFGSWTLSALGAKLSDWGFNLTRFLSPNDQTALVRTYLDQVSRVQSLTNQLDQIYSDPAISDPTAATGPLREELTQAQKRLDSLTPLAEAVLQSQLMDIADEAGLGGLGQPFPPSLYRSTPIPYSLIVSPREEIVQALDISLEPGITVAEMGTLEEQIYTELNYSALVVPIGGIGTSPTMVMQSTNLVWMTEVISHEWVHNYLTLHPLGVRYYASPELRTINETTANLAGKELGNLILLKYYPTLVPVETTVETQPETATEQEPSAFDFQAEMRITRLMVDQLLAEGQVDEAESYMEARRTFFWENGYAIRKLNQAYFAFYGAYNDEPGGGAAGEDPVGPAVQAYRSQFSSLSGFLKAIAGVTSYEELLSRIE